MNSVKTFIEFKEILKNHEIQTFSKFNVYKNPKGFLDETRKISANMKVHWKEGLPYFHFGSRVYTCHQGKDKNLGKKLKYAEKQQKKMKTDHTFQHSYILTETTKKLDCPASITVTRVYTLPHLKMETTTKSKRDIISAKIRTGLKNNENLEGEEAFWFSLPSADAHRNHTQGEISAITEPVEPVDADSPDLNENSCPSNSNDVSGEITEINEGAGIYGELEKRGSKRRKLINECNYHLKNLSSVLSILPESALFELKKNLGEIDEKTEKIINHDNSTGLPLEVEGSKRSYNNMPVDKIKIFKIVKATSKDAKRSSMKRFYSKLKFHAKRGAAGRVGLKANAMKKACKRQILFKDETKTTNVLIDGHFEIATNSSPSISHCPINSS